MRDASRSSAHGEGPLLQQVETDQSSFPPNVGDLRASSLSRSS